MYRYSNLLFFNKKGQPYNFEYDEIDQLWTGSIFLPNISTNLFEVEHIYVLEKFLYNSEVKHGTPHIHDASITPANSKWSIEWENDNTTDIFLFDILEENDQNYLNKIDTLEINVDIDENETIDTSNIKNTSVLNEAAISINIAINSIEDKAFTRRLIIYDLNTGETVAKLQVYGETTQEDERLKILSENLGYDFLDNDISIFKSSDINEDIPDNKLLNSKRKEIILEGSNIVPYIGSYKGLINAIKFYGYNNLSLREYWKNIDIYSSKYGTLISNDVINIFNEDTKASDKSKITPSNKYRKTSKFSLAYRLNNIKAGETDKYDIPYTEESSEFTFEETIVKLYGLKQKLKKYFLPSNARIIDITGEADYFSKVGQRYTINKSKSDNINLGTHPKFTVYPNKLGYIQDLRTIEDLTWPENTPYNIPHDFRELYDNNTTVSDISNVLLAYFQRYNPKLDTVNKLPDKEGIPAGYPIVLENSSFSMTWDECEVSWNFLDTDANHIYDFEPINNSSGDVYTIYEDISNEYITYTSSPSDTIEDVCNSLESLWNIKKANGELPWQNFIVKVLYDTEFFIRVQGTSIASKQAQFKFRTEVTDNTILGAEFNLKNVSLNNMYTWNNLSRGNFYDIEWTIYKEEDSSPSYYYNVRGSIEDYEKMPLVLPYTGNYTVELKLYDTYNTVSKKIEYDYITVESKEVEFQGYYKYLEKDITLQNSNYTWDSYASYWDLPSKPNLQLSLADFSWYETLNKVNSLPNSGNDPNNWIKNYQNNGDLSYKGPYYWDNLSEGLWDDMHHIWWTGMEIGSDTPAYFTINNVYYGSELIIDNGDTVTSFGFNSYDLENAADELNTSSDPIISKYIYNCVKDSSGIAQFIMAVSRYFGKYGDFNSVYGSDSNVVIGEYKNSVTLNPTWNDINILTDGKTFSPLTHISFSYDKCQIPGKNNPEWKIVNNTTGETIIINKRWLNYLFKEKGNYTITLTLRDSNKNKSIASKNLITID